MAYEGRMKVRSPYYFTAWGTILESATMQIFIWAGDEGTKPLEPAYTITKTPLKTGQDYVTFEISQLIRDYFLHNYNAEGVYPDSTQVIDALWVSLDVGIIDDLGSHAVEENLYSAVDGYGYFNEGVNPDTSYDDYTIIIPPTELLKFGYLVDDNGVTWTVYNKSNVVEATGTSSASTFAFSRLEYVTLGNLDTEYDRVEIRDTLTTTLLYTITLNVKDCDMQEAVEVRFYNKDGIIQSLFMYGRTKSAMNTKRSLYRKDLGTVSGVAQSYDTLKHQMQTYNITGDENIEVNSGYVPESTNEIYKQLLLSEYVWVDGYPATLKSNSLAFKTNKEDKLINHTFKFEIANNIINNIY